MGYFWDSMIGGKSYANHNARMQLEKEKSSRAQLRTEIAEQKREEKELEKRRRAAEKAERDLQKQVAESEKAAILARNKREFRNYEEHLVRIQSMHKTSIEAVDWREINEEEAPPRLEGAFGEKIWVKLKSKGQDVEKAKIDNFEPSFKRKLFDNLFKNRSATGIGERIAKWLFKAEDAKLAELERNFELAKKKDLAEFERLKARQEAAYQSWAYLQELSARILEGDKEKFVEAIGHFDIFADLWEYGSAINFNTTADILEVNFSARSEELVPSSEKILNKNGSLSEKDISTTQFNEIYQDYVCSCVLRIAKEIFAILPISQVYIHVVAPQLNKSTGHDDEICILSILIDKKTISRLNMGYIDPSDSMGNFAHNMDFDKKKGFQAVDKLEV